MFNTLPYPITVPLSVQSFLYFREGAAFKDAEGRQFAIQEVPPDVRCGSHRWMFVDTLPAEGFKSYHFDDSTADQTTQDASRHFVSGRHPDLASEEYVPWLPGIRLRFTTIDDVSDTWGHGVAQFGDGVAQSAFKQQHYLRGAVVDSVFRRFEFAQCEIDVVFSRYAGLDGVYVDIRVRWSAKRRILKLEFERDGLTFDHIEMQGAVGSIGRRADGTEHPMHRWIRVSGNRSDAPGSGVNQNPSSSHQQNQPTARDAGFLILQDGSFACDARDNKIRLTLVRSSVYAYDTKTALHPGDPERYTDLGEHHFVMRLLDDLGQDEAALDRSADEFVERVVVIRETP